MKRILRSGYTTGACAAAAAKGAALMIARQELAEEVTIELPAGISATFKLNGQTFSENSGACFVVKDAGDDPDVTNGAEVHASVSFSTFRPDAMVRQGEGNIIITGGKGIGRVTKPGLAVPPGEWAINPVPRLMIGEAVVGVISELKTHPSECNIVISIPDGEVRARKTLNARLGIIGGLSILGTTGIVRPISAKAWTDTIDAALDVARACNCTTVVLSTGRTSEMAAHTFLHSNHTPALSEEAFIMMGDHVAYALRACLQRSFDRPIISCQFAKLLKIACGYENTHAAASELDLTKLRMWAAEQGLPESILELIANANTAREIIIASDFDQLLIELVCRNARQTASSHALGITPSFLVADYGGAIIRRY